MCRYMYCDILCIFVRSITSVGKEKANISAIVYLTCNYVVSVRWGFLFLLVLGMGCVILLWHSLGLPFNYFVLYVPVYIPTQNKVYLT